MGIKQLFSIIRDGAPEAVKEGEIKNQFGRQVAIDASMSIYSFLLAVRSERQALMNESGETTSRLMGMFYRTLRIVDNSIKPLYAFDGAPPKLLAYIAKADAESKAELVKGRL